ncbi:hypothetical protein BJ170DRAFT_216314 [Xylariales sp. AK1849]|nr:hypothetical protein BJ170DRAFT_216314 [Xylariales sp. AK1849]
MLMFRFWASDSRGSEKTLQNQPMFDNLGKPALQQFVSEATVTSPSRPPKHRRPSDAAASPDVVVIPSLKRQRLDDGGGGSPRKEVAFLGVEKRGAAEPAPKAVILERAKEVIETEFSHAILLKHQELRFINQELAKCQVALEQLRRCHLIPYPVNVPTPDQMLSITNGQGPVVQAKLGNQVPQWAPPFGVTDGPYARHYAKWLIPDAKFDGVQSDGSAQADFVRSRHSVDGRSMRNSIAEVGSVPTKGRPGRNSASQKLQSLSSGYPQPKDKAGPCILKRADGKTVKLVCTKCHRDNFSSTQGFINHCRIAHKIEYKSHEEAAVACGHPIEAGDGGIVGEEKPPVVNNTPVSSGPVHPFARENALSESEACFSVLTRIKASLELYRKGQLPGVTSIPGVSSPSATVKTKRDQSANFTPSSESPNLSRLLQSRGKSMNFGELVRDAKTKVDLNDVSSPEEEFEESDVGPAAQADVAQGDTASSLVPRMRVPARMPMSPVPLPALPVGARPVGNKGRTPPMPYATPVPTPAPRVLDHESECPLDDEMDIDLSPNTAISNNAPSLVSDDGEYDDSMDGSSDESEVNDGLDTDSVSDVHEITFDDDHVGPRSLRHHRGSSGAEAEAMRLRKEENKHVTFMSPVKDNRNSHTGTTGRKNTL